MPSWLSFTASTFSGTPQTADVATVSVKVTASDGSASVSDTFDIVVSAAGDTTAPTLTSAIVPANGDWVQFLFSETLQQSNLPPASAFTVTADGSAVTVSGIVADHLIDSNFIITLSPDITQGQTVVVTYTDPTSGDDANAIQDATGNDAATFTTGMNSVPAVTNNSTVTTVDTTAPTLTSAIVPANGDWVQFLFSETLQQSNLPPASAFTVTADGSAVTVSGIVADHLIDSNFIITLSPDITQGQTVVVTYTDPTSGDDANAIQDATGNDAATFTTGMNSVPAVTNNSTVTTVDTTAPTLTSAIVPANGDWVQFLFSETLQQSNLPPASAFTVTADGSAVTVSGIVADHLIDSNFIITLSPDITDKGVPVVLAQRRQGRPTTYEDFYDGSWDAIRGRN